MALLTRDRAILLNMKLIKMYVFMAILCKYSKTSLARTSRGQGNDFELSGISSYMVKLYRKILQGI